MQRRYPERIPAPRKRHLPKIRSRLGSMWSVTPAPPLSARRGRPRSSLFGAGFGSLVLHLVLGAVGLVVLRSPTSGAALDAPEAQTRDLPPLVDISQAEVAPPSLDGPRKPVPDPADPAREMTKPQPPAPSPLAPTPAKPVRAARSAVKPADSPKPAPDPEGEDWLGLNKSKRATAEVEKSEASADRPDFHDELVQRLLASENRKAAERERQRAVEPAASDSDPASSPSAGTHSAEPERPATAAVDNASPVARRIAGADSLAQAAAWTVPYASATDPIWDSPGASSGRVELEVTLQSGRVASARVLGTPSEPLRRLGRSVLFYLQQGYRAVATRDGDGKRRLSISVRQSEGVHNQSLGFDPDHPRSYFTLASGRRFDAEVSLVE